MSKAGHSTRRQLLAWLGVMGVAGSSLALQACGSGADEAEAPPSEQQRRALRLQKEADAGVKDGLVGLVLGWQEGAEAQALRAAAGRTRLATGSALRGEERFLIGSNTKALTAALAARCVEQGLLVWDSRPADLLPGLAAIQLPAYQDLTLRMLLDHRAGVMAFQYEEDLSRFAAFVGAYEGPVPDTETGRRRFFVDWLLKQAPVARPGQDFRYSNAGYALAAAMLEAASGQDFKTLFARQLSEPLQLDVAWGPPQGADQPLGHEGASAQALQPWSALPAEWQRWMEVMAPAGAANLTPAAYARWLQAHQQALQGRSSALPRSYITRLQALQTDDYALGWVGAGLGSRRLLIHTGAFEGFMSLALLGQDGSMHLFGMSNTFGISADGGSWVLERMASAARAVLEPL